jgi:hypothetical protein
MHMQLEDAVLAIHNKVESVVLPPHTSHVLQPFDAKVFGTFKGKVGKALHHLAMSRKTIGHQDIPEAIKLPYEQAFMTANIKAGFAKTGLSPLKGIEVIPGDKMLPAEAIRARGGNRAGELISEQAAKEFVNERLVQHEERMGRELTHDDRMELRWEACMEYINALACTQLARFDQLEGVEIADEDESDSDEDNARVSLPANGAKLMTGKAWMDKMRDDKKTKKSGKPHKRKHKKSAMLLRLAGRNASD